MIKLLDALKKFYISDYKQGDIWTIFVYSAMIVSIFFNYIVFPLLMGKIIVTIAGIVVFTIFCAIVRHSYLSLDKEE